MAGLIPKSFISNLLERIDIVDVINERIALKKKGSNHSACCPFHNEKSPSFSVSHSKQFYHCFGCGVSGDAIAFLMEFDRLSFIEAVEQLAKAAGLEVPYEKGMRPQETKQKDDIFQLMEKIAHYYQNQLAKNPAAKNYLTRRGLSENIIKKYQIGFSADAWHQVESACGGSPANRPLLFEAGMLIKRDQDQPYDRFRNRIMFPIRNRRGQIIGFGGRSLGDDNPKYLNSPETSIFHKGNELYGLFESQKEIRDAKTIIIVEGYMDVIALAQFEIPYAVATLGTAATPEHVKCLLRYAEHLIFCFDGDNAGRKAAWRALENALPFAHEGMKIHFAFLPDGEDPDSFLHQYGKNKLLELTHTALSLSEVIIQHLTSDINLTTIEGKSRLSKLAKALLHKLKPGIFQQLLVKQLASIINMNEYEFAQNMDIVTVSPQLTRTQRPNPQSDNQSLSPMRLAITLLLHRPELAKEVKELDKLKNIQMPGIDLLINMLDLALHRPHINTAAMLQTLEDHPQAAALKKLAQRELFHTENGLKQEFVDIVNRLLQHSQESKIEQLLSKANISGLSDEERQRLQTLIMQKHQD
jgi:DNA primase